MHLDVDLGPRPQAPQRTLLFCSFGHSAELAAVHTRGLCSVLVLYRTHEAQYHVSSEW
jgi:hypothetical protein